MKRLILILSLFLGLDAGAQVYLRDFSRLPGEGTASDVRTALEGPDGQLCAVLKIETRLSGWTFDAGLSGIIDSRYEDGSIWLYIPSSARFLTVAHPQYGVLREWHFPFPLEPGATYSARLSRERPRQTSASATSSFSSSAGKERVMRSPTLTPSLSRPADEKAFCQHFADFFVGASCDLRGSDAFQMNGNTWFGFSYTWLGERIGPYISAGMDFEGGWGTIAGAAFRLTNPRSAALDWQLYGGVGFIDRGLGFDVGTRFAWRSSHRLSHWDFGVGCQYFNGTIMPTLSVGLYIWGIPAVICLGVIAGAL